MSSSSFVSIHSSSSSFLVVIVDASFFEIAGAIAWAERTMKAGISASVDSARSRLRGASSMRLTAISNWNPRPTIGWCSAQSPMPRRSIFFFTYGTRPLSVTPRGGRVAYPSCLLDECNGDFSPITDWLNVVVFSLVSQRLFFSADRGPQASCMRPGNIASALLERWINESLCIVILADSLGLICRVYVL